MLCIFSQKNVRMVFTTSTFIVEPVNKPMRIGLFFSDQNGTLLFSATYPQGFLLWRPVDKSH